MLEVVPIVVMPEVVPIFVAPPTVDEIIPIDEVMVATEAIKPEVRGKEDIVVTTKGKAAIKASVATGIKPQAVVEAAEVNVAVADDQRATAVVERAVVPIHRHGGGGSHNQGHHPNHGRQQHHLLHLLFSLSRSLANFFLFPDFKAFSRLRSAR
jgi:hypothetical protein